MISIQVDVCFTRESVPKPENQSFVFFQKQLTTIPQKVSTTKEVQLFIKGNR